MSTRCPKCKGFLVRERTARKMPVEYRCINCGYDSIPRIVVKKGRQAPALSGGAW